LWQHAVTSDENMIYRNFEKFRAATPVTFIVAGVARGGTSLLAGLLYHLGVHMGDQITRPNYESPVVKKIFKENNTAAILAFIKESEKYPYRGFKYPFLSNTFIRYARNFNNPCILYIKKNVNEVAKRRSQIIGEPFLISCLLTWLAYLKLDLICLYTRLPVLIIHYSEIIVQPELWLTEFCTRLNLINLDGQEAINFINRGNSEYRHWVNRSVFGNFYGGIDVVTANDIHGWVRHKHDNTPVAIEVYLKGTLIASGTARLYRDDVVKMFPEHNGYCGFRLFFTRSLTADEQKIISVSIGNQLLHPNIE